MPWLHPDRHPLHVAASLGIPASLGVLWPGSLCPTPQISCPFSISLFCPLKRE